MIDFLLNLDTNTLLFINGHYSTFWDIVMWNASHKFVWVPLYLLLTFYLLKKIGIKKGIFCLFIIGLLILTTDQVCSSLLRPAVARFRPSSEMNPISSFLHLVNEYRGGSFGFPSSHAANTAALAVFLSLILKSRWITLSLISWSLLVAYSRMYLGVHYPSDIIAGFIIGSLFAFIYYNLYISLVTFNYSWRRLFGLFLQRT